MVIACGDDVWIIVYFYNDDILKAHMGFSRAGGHMSFAISERYTFFVCLISFVFNCLLCHRRSFLVFSLVYISKNFISWRIAKGLSQNLEAYYFCDF